MMRTALSIAGSDSSGGAGIQADIKTMTANGVYAMTAITALTAQNTTGVTGIMEVTPEFLAQQLDSIFTDIFPDAVKIGMVSDKELIRMIAVKLRQYQPKNIVIDPVMVCKGCDLILVPDAAESIKKLLMPRCDIITPNTVEAAYLADMPEVTTVEQIKEAAEKIVAAGAKSVVIKGGERLSDNSAIDIFYDGKEFTEMAVPKIYPSYNHGAGCTFSAAITAGLANVLSMKEAVLQAKKFVTAALKHGFAINNIVGCTNHTAYRKYSE